MWPMLIKARYLVDKKTEVIKFRNRESYKNYSAK
jgi:hypothetical protein